MMLKQIFLGKHKMTLIEEIKLDQIQARKQKNSELAQILTVLIGEVEMVGKNAGNRAPTDEEVGIVVRKFIKNNDITISLSTDAVLSARLKDENCYLAQYLPQQLTVDQMQGIIVSAGLVSKKDVMQYFKANYAGMYDGKLLSGLV